MKALKSKFLQGPGISEVLRSAKRYDDFELIKNTCQAACHDKTEPGIFVKFKKPAKPLSSYLPVSPSRVLCAPGTSPYYLVWYVQPIEAKRVQMVTVDFT